MTHFVRLLVLALVTVVMAAPALAQEENKPFQLALWDPVQIHDREASVNPLQR